MTTPTFVGIVLALTAGFALFSFVKRTSKGLLPPGPKGIPLFGNFFEIPKGNEWLTFQRWSRQYDSDLIYLNLAGTPVIVVNSSHAAFDLFEKRSSLYNDRARMTMANELTGFDWLFAFMRYGDSWRERRRIFHQCFNASAVTKYNSQISKGTTDLLCRLLDSPEPTDVIQHLRLLAGSTILDIMYGFDVKDMYDSHLTTAELALHAMTKVGNAGAYVVDTIPILKYIPSWFPGAKFKRDAEEWKKYTTAMVEDPFQAVNSSVISGTVARPSLMAALLEDLHHAGPNPYQEKVIKDAFAAAYTGGADTTVSLLGSFLLAMLLYPEAQRKAQAEIDRIVGKHRLPDISDKPSLPYVTALFNEVLRWRPVAPLATPHRLTKDDVYRNFHLPEGALVIGNAWAILHDEKEFRNPNEFDPERFITNDGQLVPTVKEAQSEAFGFGRRICPGRYFAVASAWVTIAALLSTFDISKPIDVAGRPIEPSGEYTSGLLIYPKSFRCSFKPRSEEMVKLIRSRSSADGHEGKTKSVL